MTPVQMKLEAGVPAPSAPPAHITLPFPPSANRYWRNWRGRMVVSDEAKDYKAIVALLARDFEPLSGPVSVSIGVYRPARRRDLDNCLKVVLDALQGYLYENDDQIVELHARRFDDKHNPRVEIYVSEVLA